MQLDRRERGQGPFGLRGRTDASEAGHAAGDSAWKRPPAAPPAAYRSTRQLAHRVERFNGRKVHDRRQQIQLVVSQHIQYLHARIRRGRPLREPVATLSRSPATHRNGIHRAEANRARTSAEAQGPSACGKGAFCGCTGGAQCCASASHKSDRD